MRELLCRKRRLGFPKTNPFCDMGSRGIVDRPKTFSTLSTWNFINLCSSVTETTQDTTNNCGSLDLPDQIINVRTRRWRNRSECRLSHIGCQAARAINPETVKMNVYCLSETCKTDLIFETTFYSLDATTFSAFTLRMTSDPVSNLYGHAGIGIVLNVRSGRAFHSESQLTVFRVSFDWMVLSMSIVVDRSVVVCSSYSFYCPQPNLIADKSADQEPEK